MAPLRRGFFVGRNLLMGTEFVGEGSRATQTREIMKITETLRGALRRMAGVSLSTLGKGMFAAGSSDRSLAKRRRTSALPSIFNSYGPLTDAMPKPTPYNLRRFSETPIARRAINCIKDPIAGMRWRVQPRQGYALEAIP